LAAYEILQFWKLPASLSEHCSAGGVRNLSEANMSACSLLLNR